MKINKIRVGQYVLSFNINTGKYEYKKVKRVMDNGEKELITIILHNGHKLRCTPDHKLYTSDGYVEAQFAKDVLTKDGFVDIICKNDDTTEEVYDIEVQDNHNFCVKARTSNDFAVVHNCGAQVPFSSLNYGTNTTEEGRMIIRNVLLATEKGMGNGETPIFPVQIFKMKKGVNFEKGEPNYDLFELACRVSAKRLFPNFVYIDAPQNIIYYKEGRPETEMAAMGCFFRDETITFKYKNKLYKDVKGSEAFDMLKADFGLVVDNGKSEYVKLSGVEILDDNGFTECKGILKNHRVNNWVKVKTDANELILTDDHPLSVNGVRTFVKDIDLNLENTLIYNNNKVKIISIEKMDLVDDSFDVETASDKFLLSGTVSHNCRTRTISNVNGDSITVGRGNFSFTTINLPRLGIESKGDWDKFFTKLDYMMDLAKEQLEARYELISHKHVYNFPFAYGQQCVYGSENLAPNDEIKEALKNYSISIGFIGLAECMVAMTGHHHGEGKQYYDQAVDIIKHMRERTDRYTEDTHMNWSLFATPAEGLSSRFTRIDKKKYGIIPGVTDRDYYTNSFHIPVYFDITAGKKMELEGPFHNLCNAGSITYVEANGDFTKNLEAFEDLVKYGLKCGLNYFAINHPVDSCPVCGYTGIIDDECPCCGFKDGDTEMDYDKLKELQRKGMLRNIVLREMSCGACHEQGETSE